MLKYRDKINAGALGKAGFVSYDAYVQLKVKDMESAQMRGYGEFDALKDAEALGLTREEMQEEIRSVQIDFKTFRKYGWKEIRLNDKMFFIPYRKSTRIADLAATERGVYDRLKEDFEWDAICPCEIPTVTGRNFKFYPMTVIDLERYEVELPQPDGIDILNYFLRGNKK